MKKIISLVLTLVMLVSAAAVAANADGQVYVSSDFASMETFTNHFHAGALYTGDNLLYGYSEAKCLQSKGEWYQYDTTIEIALLDDDLDESDRAYSLWYCNINPEAYGRYDGTAYMLFSYDIENREFTLSAPDLMTGEAVDLCPAVPFEINEEDFNTFGLSITDKRIRCFFNDQLIFDYVDTADEYLIGRQDENTNPTPLVFWNDGNFVQIKSVKIASAGYFFPMNAEPTPDDNNNQPPVNNPDDNTGDDKNEPPVNNGDDNKGDDNKGDDKNDTPANGGDTLGGNTNSGNTNSGNTNGQGKPADTNQNKPAGGTSTSTGDAAFVAALVMVAALGCAVIVKKASVR